MQPLFFYTFGYSEDMVLFCFCIDYFEWISKQLRMEKQYKLGYGKETTDVNKCEIYLLLNYRFC